MFVCFFSYVCVRGTCVCAFWAVVVGGGAGERVRESFPEDIRPPRWLGGVGWRKKGTRLRRHWGGRFGAQRMHEVLPAAAMLAKVGRLFVRFSSSVVGRTSGFRRHGKRAGFQARFLTPPCRNTGRISCPVSGRDFKTVNWLPYCNSNGRGRFPAPS